MSDKVKVISDSISKILRTMESSFGGDVDLLAFKSDTGDAVVNELRWLGRLAKGKCDGWISSQRDDGLWPDVDYGSAEACA